MRKWKGFLPLLCLFSALHFSSCIIMNDTRGESRTCEAHHLRMKKALVGTSFGLAAYGPNPECPHPKERLNVGCVKTIWPVRRLGIVYHCQRCDSIVNSAGK